MNRRGFFGKMASIGAALGLGKFADAAPQCVPHAIPFDAATDRVNITLAQQQGPEEYLAAAKEFIDMGGVIREDEMRHILGLPEPREG